MALTHVSIKGQNLNFYLETHAAITHNIYFIRLRILPRNLVHYTHCRVNRWPWPKGAFLKCCLKTSTIAMSWTTLKFYNNLSMYGIWAILTVMSTKINGRLWKSFGWHNCILLLVVSIIFFFLEFQTCWYTCFHIDFVLSNYKEKTIKYKCVNDQNVVYFLQYNERLRIVRVVGNVVFLLFLTFSFL